MSAQKRSIRTRKGRAQESDSDDEIAILDDVPRRGRGNALRLNGGGPKSRKQKPEPEPIQNNEDVLAGFDFEGLPEEEIADIKRAIAESRNDEKRAQHAEFARLGTRTSSGDTETDDTKSDCARDIPAKADSSDKKRVIDKHVEAGEPVNDSHGRSDRKKSRAPEEQEMEPVKEEIMEIVTDETTSDDETQPPGSPASIFGSESGASQQSQRSQEKDDVYNYTTEEDDKQNNNAQVNQTGNTETMEYHLNLTVSEDENMDTSFPAHGETSDSKAELQSLVDAGNSSLGFDPSQVSTDNSQKSNFGDHSSTNHASASSRSAKQRSTKNEASGSQGSMKEASDSQGSVKSQVSASQRSTNSQASASQGSSKSQTSGSLGSAKSQVSGSQGSAKSQASGSQGSAKSQASGSQGSSKIQASKSHGSMNSEASGSQRSVKDHASGNETDQVVDGPAIPLHRHYRNVKQRAHMSQYFGPGKMDTEKSTKAILQLFEIFNRKLRASQRKCSERAEWGNPVKSGQHQAKSIDAKRRGNDSVYVFLSDEDDDFKDTVKDEKPAIGRTSTDDVDELPELGGRITRSRNGKDVNDDLLYAETQKYDFELDKENTNESCSSAKVFNVKGIRSTRNKTKPTVVESSNMPARKTRGRPKAAAMPNVIVEDTQVDDAGADILTKETRSKVDVCIEETQEPEDDFDWLNVHTNKGNEQEFENPMQKAKLQGYTIPKNVNRNRTSPENSSANTIHVDTKITGKPRVEFDMKFEFDNNVNSGNQRMIDSLVEDTQDTEDSNLAGDFQPRMRRKRTSFMLETDSEDEIVADSQDVSLSSDITVVEKGTGNSKAGLTATVSSFCNRVKNYFSPNDKKGGGVVEIEHEDETGEAQSPIIKKSRRLFNQPVVKFCDTDEVHGMNIKEKVSKNTGAHSTNSNTQKHEEKKGVKRLFSRPLSTESNVSDVSVVTSQGSSTLLDDNGDLFPTQACERRNKHGAEHRASTRSRLGASRGRRNEGIKTAANIESVDDDNSEEDCLIVGEVKKGYSKTKDKYLRQLHSQKSNLERNIDQFFKPINQTVSSMQSISRDPELDISNQQLSMNETDSTSIYHSAAEEEMNEDPILGDKSDVENMEDPLEGITNDGKKSSKTQKSEKSDSNRKTKVTVPIVMIVKIPDVSHDEELKASIHEASNIHSSPPTSARQPLHVVKARRSLSSKKHSPKEKLNNPDTASQSANLELPVVIDNQNPQNVHLNINTSQVFAGARPKLPRHRKVSETITSADLEDGEIRQASRKRGHVHMDEHFIHHEDHAALLGGRVTRKRRQMGHEVEMVQPAMKSQKTLRMVACPLCNLQFSENIIEMHAANCVGPEPGDFKGAAHHPHAHNLDDSEEEEEVMACHHHGDGILSQHEAEMLSQHHSQAHLEHMRHHEHLHHMMEQHHNHNAHALPHGLEHVDDEDLDEEEEELEQLMSQHSAGIAHIADEDVQNVVKQMRISPGEFGEIRLCYICDKNIPKNHLERHIAVCMMMAKQQQAEVDEKGFDNVYNQPEEDVPVRTTRTRRAHSEITEPSTSTGTRSINEKMEPTTSTGIRSTSLKTEPTNTGTRSTAVKAEPTNTGTRSTAVKREVVKKEAAVRTEQDADGAGRD